jgi:hypothetical protein
MISRIVVLPIADSASPSMVRFYADLVSGIFQSSGLIVSTVSAGI